jgi:hypothetical protein
MRSAALSLFLLMLMNDVAYGAQLLLSIPEKDTNATERKAEIKAAAKLISNQPRSQVVHGVKYPLPPGPIPVKGSLTEKLAVQETALANSYQSPNVETIFFAAETTTITSFADY